MRSLAKATRGGPGQPKLLGSWAKANAYWYVPLRFCGLSLCDLIVAIVNCYDLIEITKRQHYTTPRAATLGVRGTANSSIVPRSHKRQATLPMGRRADKLSYNGHNTDQNKWATCATSARLRNVLLSEGLWAPKKTASFHLHEFKTGRSKPWCSDSTSTQSCSV